MEPGIQSFPSFYDTSNATQTLLRGSPQMLTSLIMGHKIGHNNHSPSTADWLHHPIPRRRSMIHTRIEPDDAWKILEPSVALCVDTLLDYLAEVNDADVYRIRAPMGPRSFCSTLTDYFYSKMEQSSQHGVSFERRSNKGQHYIVFSDRVAVRVKQVDRQYLSKNLPTSHSRLWNQQLAAPGMEPLPKLELGYHLDPLMNSYIGLHLLQRIGNSVDWRIQIYGIPTDTFEIQEPRLDGLGETRQSYQYRPVR